MISFANRYDKYLDPGFFQHRIHWFSIFNSFMMVIFLVGLVSMILMRTLRKDYARYSREEDLDEMVSGVLRFLVMAMMWAIEVIDTMKMKLGCTSNPTKLAPQCFHCLFQFIRASSLRSLSVINKLIELGSNAFLMI